MVEVFIILEEVIFGDKINVLIVIILVIVMVLKNISFGKWLWLKGKGI